MWILELVCLTLEYRLGMSTQIFKDNKGENSQSWFLFVIYDFSRRVWTYILKHKNDTF